MKIYNYFKNLIEENISQERRLKKTDETRNYLIEEINRNELISKKHKKVCTTQNYIAHFLILGSYLRRKKTSAFCINWETKRSWGPGHTVNPSMGSRGLGGIALEKFTSF